MTIVKTMIGLANLHRECGLIGISEYMERVRVAQWLKDDGVGTIDPRSESEPEVEAEDCNSPEIQNVEDNGPRSTSNDDDGKLDFIWFDWVFTRQDDDPYPSTPHGHLHGPNRPWPKLNPYTGRVYGAKEQEEKKRRLSKKQMILLWSNQKFREFCRSHIVWYMEAHPYYDFQVVHPLRFPKPWRQR